MAGGSLIGLLLLEFHLDIVIVISVTLVQTLLCELVLFGVWFVVL
jgi:hypothetical protein